MGGIMEEMAKGYQHIPVLLGNILEDFSPLFRDTPEKPSGPVRILDGTLGLGGHSGALLAAHPDCEILGLDRDTEAMGLARERLSPYGSRLHTVHCRFSDFSAALREAGWDSLDGAMIDIGVSSLQLDEESRGFSVHGDGPLDMRMDAASGSRSARDIVNTAGEKELRDLIASYGEDPLAGRIARAICEARREAPIETTGRLAEIISRAYPAAWRAKARHHPATRTFQALRMAVNDELGELGKFLDGILPSLRMGGRLAVITFHSLEDRMVKQRMHRWAQGCLCPKYVTHCTCHHVPEVRILHKKPVTAGEDELLRNPRASSAKLRSCERIAPYVNDREKEQEGGEVQA